MPFRRKYNTAITATTAQSIKIPLIKRGVVDFAVSADWTPAAGDVKVSKDGGAAASIATLPAAVAMGNTAYWEFVFSATELSCGNLVVTVADSATKAVEDQSFSIETFGDPSAMYPDDDTASLFVTGKAVTGTLSTTVATTNLTDADNVHLGSYIRFISGSLAGETRKISAYANTNGQVTVATAFTTSPSNNDKFIIIGRSE